MFEITIERQNKLHAALARLTASSRRWVSLEFFTDAEITAAKIWQVGKHSVERKVKLFIGKIECIGILMCFPAPRIGAFDDLAAGLSQFYFLLVPCWRTIH